MLLAQPRPRRLSLSPVLPSATLPHPRRLPRQVTRHAPVSLGIPHHVVLQRERLDHDQLRWIEEHENVESNVLRKALQARLAKIGAVSAELIQQGIDDLMTVPPGQPCPVALGALGNMLGIRPCPSQYLVDIEGNPWTEHILTILDALLVLISPFEPDDDGQTANKQSGNTAANVESRFILLIRYSHHHMLRAIWYALLYLVTVCPHGSPKTRTIRHLLDMAERQLMRVRFTLQSYGNGRLEDEAWLDNFRLLKTKRDLQSCGGSLSLAVIWSTMKGMGTPALPAPPTSIYPPALPDVIGIKRRRSSSLSSSEAGSDTESEPSIKRFWRGQLDPDRIPGTTARRRSSLPQTMWNRMNHSHLSRSVSPGVTDGTESPPPIVRPASTGCVRPADNNEQLPTAKSRMYLSPSPTDLGTPPASPAIACPAPMDVKSPALSLPVSDIRSSPGLCENAGV